MVIANVSCQSQGATVLNLQNWRLSTLILVFSAAVVIVTSSGFFLWMLIGSFVGTIPSPESTAPVIAIWLYCVSFLAFLNSLIIAHRCGTALGAKFNSVKYKIVYSIGILIASGTLFLVIFLPVRAHLPKLIQDWLVLLWAWLASSAVSAAIHNCTTTEIAS